VTPGHETLRRVLLILVVGLIVARPAVSGEDPGMRSDWTDPGGMILTLLTFVAALAWAGWRLWSGQGAVRFGLVDAALLAVAVLLAVSTYLAADYKRPGELIAWEWLALWLTFFLVRQLSTTAEEQQGMLAAVLAGVVALSAFGIYQAVAELPRKAKDLQQRKAGLEQRNTAQTDPESERRIQRVAERDVSATFRDPGIFAGYLVLMLPVLVGAAVGFRRGPAPGWQAWLAAGCVALAGVALWLTHRPAAVVVLLLTALVAAAWARLSSAWARVGAVLAGVAILAAGAYGLARARPIDRERFTAAIDDRLAVWAGTWRMMEGHTWLGVGPDRFAALYPRYMAETAWEKPDQPHNFPLEMWSAGGIFTAAALLLALAAFFWQLTRRQATEFGPRPPTTQPPTLPTSFATSRPPEVGRWPPTTQPPNHPTTQPPEQVRWEYYLGGMLGVLLAFILRAAALLDRDEIFHEAIGAGIRAVAWFAAIALFELVPWSPRLRVAALGTGVAALVAYLFVADGIGLPALAGPMWVAAALALAAASVGPAAWFDRRLERALPIPILAAVALGYALFWVVPVTNSANAIHHARGELAQGEQGKSRPEEKRTAGRASFLQRRVLEPLEEAGRDDPTCSRTFVHLSSWCTHWRTTFGRYIRVGKDVKDVEAMALENARAAQQKDPQDKAGFLAEYEMYKAYAQAKEKDVKQTEKQLEAKIEALQKAAPNPKATAKQKKDQQRQTALAVKQLREAARRARRDRRKDYLKDYRRAAAALRECVSRDPTEASLHYLLADALARAGDLADSREEAVEALRLDKRATRSQRRLTNDERGEVRKLLSSPPAK
jgi:O-antigen ligase/tetratricopeptide (TPR) repeat protein